MLRKVKKDFQVRRQPDNVVRGNRFTDAIIDKLLSCYGNATRYNSGKLTKMQNAVWTFYYH